MVFFCHHCGQEIETDHKTGREEKCPKCGGYLHCCLNCMHYNPLAHWECNETEIEWVADKRAGNFCDYFQPSGLMHPPNKRREDARKKLDDLFKKSSGS